MEKFSFIVLYHNNTHTDRVLDAVLEQTEDGDEIIVVNSQSESLKIFDRFRDRIRIVNSDKEKNRSYNRNFGAKHARNPYLFFLDGDMLLLPHAVFALRTSLTKGYCAAVGNIIKGSNTPEQMQLLTGTNYVELLTENVRLETLVKMDIASDRRQIYLTDKIASDCLWEYFFSGYCAIVKSAFDEVGGFDTCFQGWGVEDVEIGYRLSKIGDIDYNHSAYGAHIPHARDLYECLVSNRKNFYKFLAKTPDNELEIHINFGGSTKVFQTIDYIKKGMFAVKMPEYTFELPPNSLFMYPVSQKNPNGFVRFSNDCNEEKNLRLYGMALPFRNKNFDCAYCGEEMFLYPEKFLVCIFAEMLRVSQKIVILKTNCSERIQWQQERLGGLQNVSTTNKIVALPTGLSDFDIKDLGDRYEIDSGVIAKMNDNFVIDENDYQAAFFEKRKPKYIVLNLRKDEIAKNEISALEQKYGIGILDCYHISLPLTHEKMKLSQLLYGDLYRLHTPILYLLPAGYRIDYDDDRWWKNTFRKNDIVVQNT